jgi:hypothetical protein
MHTYIHTYIHTHRDASSRPSFEALNKTIKTFDVSKWTYGVEKVHRKESNKSSNVLYDMFPKHVADALMEVKACFASYVCAL